MLLECRVLITLHRVPLNTESRNALNFFSWDLAQPHGFIIKRYTKIDFAQQRKSHLLKVSMWPGTQGGQVCFQPPLCPRAVVIHGGMGDFCPRWTLGVSGDIPGCHSLWGGASGIFWVEARAAASTPPEPWAAPQHRVLLTRVTAVPR